MVLKPQTDEELHNMYSSHVFQFVSFGFKCTLRFVICIKYYIRSYVIRETGCGFYNKVNQQYVLCSIYLLSTQHVSAQVATIKERNENASSFQDHSLHVKIIKVNPVLKVRLACRIQQSKH